MKWVNGQLVENKYGGPTSAAGDAGGDMSEVKLKWVHKRSLYDVEELKRLFSVIDDVQPYMVPVLTLDQITAWLVEEQLRQEQMRYVKPSITFLDDLLAQVQAWKEGK